MLNVRATATVAGTVLNAKIIAIALEIAPDAKTIAFAQIVPNVPMVALVETDVLKLPTGVAEKTVEDNAPNVRVVVAKIAATTITTVATTTAVVTTTTTTITINDKNGNNNNNNKTTTTTATTTTTTNNNNNNNKTTTITTTIATTTMAVCLLISLTSKYFYLSYFVHLFDKID